MGHVAVRDQESFKMTDFKKGDLVKYTHRTYDDSCPLKMGSLGVVVEPWHKRSFTKVWWIPHQRAYPVRDGEFEKVSK